MTYSDQFNIRSRFVKFNDVADAIDGLITRQNAPNTSGSSTAYSINPLPTWASIPTGSFVVFVPHLTNGATATLTVNNIGPSPLLRGGVNIAAGAMLGGVPYLCLYNGVGWEVLSSTEVPAARFLPITLDQVNNRVGINQATPTVALHVLGSNAYSGEANVSGVLNANSASAGVVIGSINGNAPYIAAGKMADGSGLFTPLRLRTSNTDRLVIATDGNITVGGQISAGALSAGNSYANLFYSERPAAASEASSGFYTRVDGSIYGGMYLSDQDRELTLLSAERMLFRTFGAIRGGFGSDGFWVNGPVGVGTESVTAALEVATVTGRVMAGTTLQGLVAGSGNSGAIYLGVDAASAIRPTAGIEASWGASNGVPQLGIGITRDGNGTKAIFSFNNTINFYVGNVERGGIDSNGYWYLGTSGTRSSQSLPNAVIDIASGGIYRSGASSLRYKKDIRDYTMGLDEIMTLRPVYYKMLEPALPSDYREFSGFIAEEVHAAGLPEYVLYDELERPDALNYGGMVVLTCKAIQELNQKVEELKARLDNL